MPVMLRILLIKLLLIPKVINQLLIKITTLLLMMPLHPQMVSQQTLMILQIRELILVLQLITSMMPSPLLPMEKLSSPMLELK